MRVRDNVNYLHVQVTELRFTGSSGIGQITRDIEKGKVREYVKRNK